MYSYARRTPWKAVATLAAGSAAASSQHQGANSSHIRNQWVAPPTMLCEEMQPTRHPKFNRDWDFRHPQDDGVAPQGRTRVILLVRHGQYHTTGGPEYGRLTDLGREQAEMAGQHVAARMREDPSLKKAMLKMTSSALDRAIETADIMQIEIEKELAWVSVPSKIMPPGALLRLEGAPQEGFVEAIVVDGIPETIVHNDTENLLQPKVELKTGSRLRIKADKSRQYKEGSSVTFVDMATSADHLCVYSSLAKVKCLDARFDEWKCSGCRKENPRGDVHWSDDAENNGLGFCDECFEKGPKHKKLMEGDTLARKTEGSLRSAVRAPNDKNLNEADVDTLSVLVPTDGLYKHFGTMNAVIQKEKAATDAGFYAHMHREIDHKHIRRKDRQDVISFVFKSRSGEKFERRWTAKEFAKLDVEVDATHENAVKFPYIFCENASERVEGPFTLSSIGDATTGDEITSKDKVKELVRKSEKELLKKRPGKQLEILIIHQNLIRYFFLKALQYDTTTWLNFGGGNCTMTQLRITPKGDVICDFFADHGSFLPVSHYTFNRSPNV